MLALTSFTHCLARRGRLAMAPAGVLLVGLLTPVRVWASEAAAPLAHVWQGPDGRALPWRSEEDVLAFLRSAEVVSYEEIGEGVNHSLKVLLKSGETRAHAAFRDVRIKLDRWRSPQGMEFNFRDDAIFEAAAYELSRLLGLNIIPPTVARTILDRKGTLQLWIEAAMSEKARVKRHLEPRDVATWLVENETMILFDNLVYNDDRNQGNILFDSSGKRWLIDHTRTFRRYKRLKDPDKLKRCDRELWGRLKVLEERVVRKQLKNYLTPVQIRAVLARRDLLVEHFQARIDRWGEGSILIRPSAAAASE